MGRGDSTVISKRIPVPTFDRVFSWSCAFTVLLFSFCAARYTFHRLPTLAALLLNLFKYGSMFYVAGQLIEWAWCSVSNMAGRALASSGSSEVPHG
jgi:hypothetical protein